MSDAFIRKLQRQFSQGDHSVLSALIKELFRTGTATNHLDLIPYIGELETYRKGLAWPDMTQKDLDTFHYFVESVDRGLRAYFDYEERQNVTGPTTRLGFSPYEEITPLYRYTSIWHLNPQSFCDGCDGVQVQLHFSRDPGFLEQIDEQRRWVDGELRWVPIMEGPWYLSIWITIDEEMEAIGDPTSYTEHTYSLRSTNIVDILERAQDQYDEHGYIG